MILTYTPAEGDKREWSFRPGKLPHYEAEAIEKKTGWTLAEFAQALPKGSVLAARAAVWVLLKREDPPLRFDQVAITSDEVSILFEAPEVQQILDSLDQAGAELDDDTRDQVRAMLRRAAAPGAYPDDDDDQDPDDPKDPPSSPSSN